MTLGLSALLVAAAEQVIPCAAMRKPQSYATWSATRRDDDFDVDSSLRYLRNERHYVDEPLLRRYGDIHANHASIDLRDLPAIAAWIDCLDDPFVEYASFRKLREPPRYVGIVTFTTPEYFERITMSDSWNCGWRTVDTLTWVCGGEFSCDCRMIGGHWTGCTCTPSHKRVDEQIDARERPTSQIVKSISVAAAP